MQLFKMENIGKNITRRDIFLTEGLCSCRYLEKPKKRMTIRHAGRFWSTPATDAYSGSRFWVDMKDAHR